MFGLQEGGVTVLIHTGSRGFGHQVCTDYVERFLEVAPKYGIELMDKQLASAPIESPEEYLKGMSAAANFAFANRQLITHFVRQAFDVAGHTGHGLKVLYKLAHNNAKFEKHGCRRVLVHRKGPARAFGPAERSPRRLPFRGPAGPRSGGMGRCSFVLAGTEGPCARPSDRAHVGWKKDEPPPGKAGG